MVAATTQRTGAAALIKALGHPLRAQLLTIFTERVASPNELANELGEGLSQTSYHVKVLRDLDLIELQSTQPRRGAVEHFYKATARPMLHNEEWEQLDPLARQAFSGYIVETLLADAAKAMQAGTFDKREDRHLSRSPVLVDEEGWREVAAAQDAALQSILDAQAASAERMTASGEEGVPVIAGMVCFEMPGPRPKK